MKDYREINVYQAFLERIEYIFKEFENIYVAFSGGKDSGLLLNMVIKYMKDNGINRKIGLFHVDYECQYKKTTDYVKAMETKYKKYIELYHICLPLKAQNSVSMNNGYWRPWDPEHEELWVRKMPKNSINIHNHEFGEYFDMDMTDYDFNMAFAEWYASRKQGKTICLLGIRADESFSRYIRVRSGFRKYEDINYIYELKNTAFNGYPLYDWGARDIWVANGKFKFEYNELYDLFYQAGVPIEKMRVASPFNDCAGGSLKLYKVIDPNMWGKMISRVNGVNFTGIYGGTTAMGWKSIKKPDHFTWKQYLEFLLSTLDKQTRENYERKFATSIKFWKERGGVLKEETIQELKESGVKFRNRGRISKLSDKNSIAFPKYPDDVNVTSFQDVPSFKRMCVCILKNDWYCKYMGFTQTKRERMQRQLAIDKYKNL